MNSKQINFKIKVFYEDTDYAGVVYYASYLKYFERARTNLLINLYPTIKKILLEGKFFFVVRKIDVTYLKPCLLFDDLVVFTTIKQVRKTSILVEQVLTKDNQTHCVMNAQLVWIEANTQKPKKIINELSFLLNRIKLV
tara:strand:- start:559 stop:975 length:417 start_codon:yes stop_codon:yes gene_type:complete